MNDFLYCVATLHRAMVAKPDNAAGSSDVSFKNLLPAGRTKPVRTHHEMRPVSVNKHAAFSVRNPLFSVVIGTIVISAKLCPKVNY
jgi:hypothetical protein